MSKKSDQRDLHWARQHFPLLARRSDAEILRVVKEAREQLGSVAKIIATSGGVLGFLFGSWVEEQWLPEIFSGPVESVVPILGAALVAYASGVLSEHLVRRRIETILLVPGKRH